MQTVIYFALMLFLAMISGTGLGLVHAPWWLMLSILSLLIMVFGLGALNKRLLSNLRG